jgi:TolA-binding protein
MKNRVNYLLLQTLSIVAVLFFVSSCSPVRTRPKSSELHTRNSSEVPVNNKNNVVSNNKNNEQSSQNQLDDKIVQSKEMKNIDHSIIESEELETKKIPGILRRKAIDTTNIDLTIEPVSNKEFTTNFNSVVMDFDIKKYESACQKFEDFANTLPENDSLYYESLFFMGECKIVEELYLKAEQTFNKILNGIKVPNDIKQRAILRLGQIYCIQNKKDESEKMFSRLKKDYPKSIYLQLANCNF